MACSFFSLYAYSRVVRRNSISFLRFPDSSCISFSLSFKASNCLFLYSADSSALAIPDLLCWSSRSATPNSRSFSFSYSHINTGLTIVAPTFLFRLSMLCSFWLMLPRSDSISFSFLVSSCSRLRWSFSASAARLRYVSAFAFAAVTSALL